MSSNTFNSQSITIRKGISKDLPEMLELFTSTIDEVCQKDYKPQQIEAWKSGAENKERWINVISSQHVLIAENGNQIVGFCTLDKGNYIDLLFVHKDYQQKGIAAMLYHEIEKEALEHDTKQITADVSKTARPFFEKMGFHVIKEQIVHVRGIALTNYKMTKKFS
ncbi:GNAT family N-acetyltransferase [Chryseobacterium sp.]|jgi:putative acetyltransferase|uniref:GNAT family N-acetyltransferase n=1 Tax=Chryseobacterium sp. TaxID=1871047 RepID=UPI00284D4B49|nr:GNAT family N-acetyltransferase [Chryseobacterium sp.]MDR3026242.1 GNAT family N-acetyltransferase [Chryseobacterium sp.]